RRVRPWRAADRALIDVDDLVDALETFDPLVNAGDHLRPVEVPGECVIEDVADERGLPRPRHTGHGDEQPEWELDGEIAEVVVARPHDAEHPFAVRHPASRRD